VGRDKAWWIGSSKHTVSDVIPAPPDAVRAFYVDLRNIARVHPLVISVTPGRREESSAGYAQTYAVRDRIPLGPFAVNIGYTARVQVSHDGEVHTEARQFPRVRLYGTVSFDDVAGGTLLTERLCITAPRPLAAFTVRQAVTAHEAMLTGIRSCFEPA
jgi:hypothetical protein